MNIDNMLRDDIQIYTTDYVSNISLRREENII